MDGAFGGFNITCFAGSPVLLMASDVSFDPPAVLELDDACDWVVPPGDVTPYENEPDLACGEPFGCICSSWTARQRLHTTQHTHPIRCRTILFLPEPNVFSRPHAPSIVGPTRTIRCNLYSFQGLLHPGQVEPSKPASQVL